MQVIAIANQKGGVAKTTTTLNLGISLSKLNKKVLLLDLDPQANLTLALGLEPLDYENTMVSVMEGSSQIIDCVNHIRDNVDIITSRLELAGQEMGLVVRTMRELVLSKALSYIEDDYDYALIDCPPQLSILTINALSAADRVVVPCKTEYLAYRGLEQLYDTIQGIIEEVNPALDFAGVIATMYEKKINDDNEIVEYLSEKYPLLGVVKKGCIVKKAVYGGKAVCELVENNAISVEYNRIAKELDKWV